MMEASGGARLLLTCHSPAMENACPSFRAHVFPYLDRPNLTVLTHALVDPTDL